MKPTSLLVHCSNENKRIQVSSHRYNERRITAKIALVVLLYQLNYPVRMPPMGALLTEMGKGACDGAYTMARHKRDFGRGRFAQNRKCSDKLKQTRLKQTHESPHTALGYRGNNRQQHFRGAIDDANADGSGVNPTLAEHTNFSV